MKLPADRHITLFATEQVLKMQLDIKARHKKTYIREQFWYHQAPSRRIIAVRTRKHRK